MKKIKNVILFKTGIITSYSSDAVGRGYKYLKKDFKELPKECPLHFNYDENKLIGKVTNIRFEKRNLVGDCIFDTGHTFLLKESSTVSIKISGNEEYGLVKNIALESCSLITLGHAVKSLNNNLEIKK